MKTLLAFASGAYLISAFVAASFGVDYLVEGVGLNPWLAFPATAVCAGMSYFTAHIASLIDP